MGSSAIGGSFPDLMTQFQLGRISLRDTRHQACIILLDLLKEFTPTNKSSLQYLTSLAKLLGNLAFHYNLPTLTEELDWRKLLSNATDAGTLNEIGFVVLEFLGASINSSSPVFTSSCAWVRSIVKEFFASIERAKPYLSEEVYRIYYSSLQSFEQKEEEFKEEHKKYISEVNSEFDGRSIYSFPACPFPSLAEFPEEEHGPGSIWAREAFDLHDTVADYNSVILLPDKKFLNYLGKYVCDMRALFGMLPERYTTHKTFTNYLKIMTRITDHALSLDSRIWEEILRETVFVYVTAPTDFLFTRTSDEIFDNLIARYCYRRVVHSMIKIFSLRYVETDLTTIISYGVFSACQNVNVSLKAVKDLLESIHVECLTLDQTIKDLFLENYTKESVVLLHNFARFADTYERLGLNMVLPKVGTILHFIEAVPNPYDQINFYWISNFQLGVEKIYCLFNMVASRPKGCAEVEAIAIQKMDKWIVRNKKFNLRYSLVSHAAVAMRVALSMFPPVTADVPDVEFENCAREYCSDAWATMVGYLFNICPINANERSELFAELMNLIGNFVMEQNGNVKFYKLFSRAVISLLRYILHDEISNFEKHSFYETFISLMFELQPTIHPTFAYIWLSMLSNSFVMNNMMNCSEERIPRRYIQCIVTGFHFLQDIFENGLQNTSTDKLAIGLRNTLVCLCTVKGEFFAKHHFHFVPTIPIYFQFIRHIFLIATEKPIRRSVLVTLQQFLKQSQSSFHPYCHFQEFPQCPKNIRDLLILIPECTKFDDIAKMLLPFFEHNKSSYWPYNNVRLYSFVLASIVAAVNHIIANGGMIELQTVKDSGFVTLFLGLFQQLEKAGIFFIINVIVDQVRYPNSHTSFCICMLTILFNNSDEMKDMITSVLFRQLSITGASRYGLLILGSELAYSGNLLETKEMSDPLIVEFTSRLKLFAEEAHLNSRGLD